MEVMTKEQKRLEKKRKKLEAMLNLTEKSDEKKVKLDTEPIDVEKEIGILRKKIRERCRTVHPPKIGLKPLGERAHLDNDPNTRSPIFITDVPNLLLRIFLKDDAPDDEWPWYKAEHTKNISTTVLMFIEGISLFHFQMYPQCFENSLIYFENRLEVLLPPYKGEGEIIKELISCPLTFMQKKSLISTYGCIDVAKLYLQKNPLYLIKSVFPIESPPISDLEMPNSDKFPRTHLLLSPVQMIGEQYPFPMNGMLSHRYKKFVMTCNCYAEVTPSSPLFAIDCEMVKTKNGITELARISIVNEEGKQIYDSLVKPKSVVIDYLTPFSGITKEMLKDITKGIEQVQNEVRALLPPDAILVGHSLENDLIHMKMMHPYIIDTSIIFNLTGIRKYKSKLKVLTKKYFNEDIQNERTHDSVEDAVAALNLVKLKLANSIEFGDELFKAKRRSHLVYSHLRNMPESSDSTKNGQNDELEIKTNVLQTAKDVDYRVSVVASEQTKFDHESLIKSTNLDSKNQIEYHRMENNQETINKTVEIANECDLVLSHLKIQSEDFDPSNVEEQLKGVDGYVSTVRKSLKANSLMIVVLGGTPGGSTGVVMLGIKKNMPRSSKI